MSEWLPIETAPKDGTRIVAMRNEKGRNLPAFIHWDSEDGWCGMTVNDEKIIAIHEPTHWFPLPWGGVK